MSLLLSSPPSDFQGRLRPSSGCAPFREPSDLMQGGGGGSLDKPERTKNGEGFMTEKLLRSNSTSPFLRSRGQELERKKTDLQSDMKPLCLKHTHTLSLSLTHTLTHFRQFIHIHAPLCIY